MTSENKIDQLTQALRILKELPVMKLAENRNLVQEIKNIVTSRNLWSIVDDIKYERQIEKQSVRNSNNSKSSVSPESQEFLHAYAKYQGAAHKVLAQNAPAKMTQLIDRDGVLAFNEGRKKESNPFLNPEIVALPETKAFNSIFSDRALQIGTPNDPTRMSSYIDYSPYIWNYQYYLSIPTLAQTIDLPINMATRKVPKIITKNHEFSKALDKRLKILRFNDKVMKMLLYSSLSPRGALIVPIIEGDRVRFNTFNDTQFTYATSYQYSRMDFKDNNTGVSQLFCLGNLLQNEVTAHFLCPGFEPIFAIGKNKLFQLKDAAEAVNIYLYTIKVLCIRAQVLVQKWSGEGQNDSKLAALQRMTSEINSTLSLSTAVNLPEDASLDILNNNLSPGFADVAPIVKEYQGMLTGVTGEFFYGSSTASYAGNNFNMRVSHQNVHSDIQENQIMPIYRFAITSLLEHDKEFQKFENERDDYELEFESLYEPTEQEKLADDALRIDNIIKMRDYPELEDIFKKEGLMREEFTFSKLDPHNNDRQPNKPET